MKRRFTHLTLSRCLPGTLLLVVVAVGLCCCVESCRGDSSDTSGGAGGSITFSDMSLCRPADALSRQRKRGRWQLLDYQAEGVSGTMLAAAVGAQAPPAALPVGVTGWHRIYVGFWCRPYGGDKTTVRLKLSNDVAFTRISHYQGHSWTRTDIKEAFWKRADLTGQDIVIGQKTKGTPTKAYVAYIRLEPMTPDEVTSLQKDRARRDTRKVIAVFDGAGWLQANGPTTRADLAEQIEPFRHSDVGRVFFAVNYGVTTNYPSKVGVLCAGDGEVFNSVDAGKLYKHLHALLDSGLVPYVVAMEQTQAMGLEFHVQFRMGLGDDSGFQGEGQGGLAERHPELRLVAKDGTPLPKLSYAFPACRQFMVDLMREVTAHDLDGINLCFIRGPLFVGYEKPVVDSFIAKYNVDPRKLSDTDDRWLRHKAGYVTQLVRQMRKLADEVSKKRGRKLELSAWVYGRERQNIYHGLDSRTWLNEGLIDAIGGIGEPELVGLARQVGCKVYWGTGARTPKNYINAANHGHKRGGDGFLIWDTDGPYEQPEHWEILRNLGHPAWVETIRKSGNYPTLRRMKVLNVGGDDFGHTTNKGVRGPPEMMIMFTNG